MVGLSLEKGRENLKEGLKFLQLKYKLEDLPKLTCL